MVVYAALSAFMVYSCMYAFRKPYTAATFSSTLLWGASYKVLLVIAQTLGYMAGKFYGIKFIAGIAHQRRGPAILMLISTAWLALLLFAIVPAPYNLVFMFVNGFPLAMVWGLVFGFIEGRKQTELMGAILATSFIFASGFAKTIGKWLMLSMGISEWWMPFLTGAIFIVPLFVGVWLLRQTPPPSAADEQHRTVRRPMTRVDRQAFLKRFAKAMAPVIIAYILLTILRDFIEDFANEVWTETGYAGNAGIFAQTSILVSLIVLAVVGGFFLIKNNYRAFQLNHFIIIGGFLLAAGATALFNAHLISPIAWMVSASAGLYLGYVPYNCLYFERMLAAYKVEGNVGFVMYIADSFGYLGTVIVLLIKEFASFQPKWVDFFSMMFYTAAVLGVILVFWGSALYKRIYVRQLTAEPAKES